MSYRRTFTAILLFETSICLIVFKNFIKIDKFWAKLTSIPPSQNRGQNDSTNTVNYSSRSSLKVIRENMFMNC